MPGQRGKEGKVLKSDEPLKTIFRKATITNNHFGGYAGWSRREYTPEVNSLKKQQAFDWFCLCYIVFESLYSVFYRLDYNS